ncbi:MAG: zinc ribbon domain-containing protein [Lachnospiraceae bacterium]|nr:zinc ribbon domain-containing protein [Lachnospiraceae bacterium]
MDFKKSFSKGITKINVKTSNFMEENKFKTQILTLESEIEKSKSILADFVYHNWKTENYSEQSIDEMIKNIRDKYDSIENLKKEIDLLYQKEREILGGSDTNVVEVSDKIFCSKCGKETKKGHKFCEQCGNRLEG